MQISLAFNKWIHLNLPTVFPNIDSYQILKNNWEYTIPQKYENQFEGVEIFDSKLFFIFFHNLS